MSRLLAVAVAALLAAPAPADDTLLKSARAANRASVAKVQAWRGTVDLQSQEQPDPGRAAGTFTRAGDRVRATVTVRGETTDVASTATGRRVLVTTPAVPGDLTNYGEVYTEPGGLPPGDPWECGLFAFTLVQGPPLFLLDDWLSDPAVSDVVAAPATRDGKPVVRVTATATRWKFRHEFDLDPAVGHLVRAHRVRNESEAQRDAPPLPAEYVTAVTTFAEAKPGVFVPTAVRRSGTAGRRDIGFEWAATGVAVNDPLPADAFTLTFPAGLRVVDEVKQGTFRTDAAGQSGEWARTPAGQPYAFAGRVPPEVAAAAPPPPPTAAGMDPTVVWPIALVAAAVLVGVAVVVVGLGRRRK